MLKYQTTTSVPSALAQTITDDSSYETNTCSGNVVHICYAEEKLHAGDSLIGFYDFSSIRAISGPITINGLTFNEIRCEPIPEPVNNFASMPKA